jgi:hypothetical protein
MTNEGLNYCFRIIYDDGEIYTHRHLTLTPELLISVFDNGGPMDVPTCNNLEELTTLFYENLDEFHLNKEKVVEVQIINLSTNEIIYSKKLKHNGN